MEQKGLEMFGVEIEKKGIVKVTERRKCFEVLNGDDFDVSPSMLSEPKIKINAKCGTTKEKFEKDVEKCFRANVEWVKDDEVYFDEKFGKSGEFWLDDVKIKWTYDDKISYHLSFDSFYEEKGKEKIRKPNILTESGYRSHFFGGGIIIGYDTIEEVITEIIKSAMKEKKYKKAYKLEFERDVPYETLGGKNGVGKVRLEKPLKYANYNKIKEEKEEKIKPLIKISRRSDKTHLVIIDGEMMGLHSKDSEKKEKEEVETKRQELIEMGFKRGQIKIMEETYTYPNDEPKFVEKKIKELSEELKKYLAKKYGFDVKIIVEKGVKENGKL